MYITYEIPSIFRYPCNSNAIPMEYHRKFTDYWILCKYLCKLQLNVPILTNYAKYAIREPFFCVPSNKKGAQFFSTPRIRFFFNDTIALYICIKNYSTSPTMINKLAYHGPRMISKNIERIRIRKQNADPDPRKRCGSTIQYK